MIEPACRTMQTFQFQEMFLAGIFMVFVSSMCSCNDACNTTIFHIEDHGCPEGMCTFVPTDVPRKYQGALFIGLSAHILPTSAVKLMEFGKEGIWHPNQCKTMRDLLRDCYNNGEGDGEETACKTQLSTTVTYLSIYRIYIQLL